MTSLLTKHIKPQYLAATRMFGYALTLGERETWLGAIDVFRCRLSPSELASLGYAILRAQNPEHAKLTARFALGLTSTPMPAFLSAMYEAGCWADSADPNFIKAIVLAGFNKMTPQDQVAFLDHVLGSPAR